jgi:sugar/nucleoside kinase (ribokinase family)
LLITCAGIFVIDLIATDLPKVSDSGELTYAPKGIEMHSGGHAGNVSIDLRKLGLREGEVSSVGAVGEDIFGVFQENLLKSYGIITHLQKISSVGTAKNLVLVVTGEDRRFHVDIGANMYLNPEYILSILEEEKPLIFYAGGVGFTGKFDDRLDEVLKKAQNFGCLTFVDPVTPYKHGWEFITSSMRFTDIFHCNIDEAYDITHKDNPREAAEALVNAGAGLVILSLGKKGLVAATTKTFFEMSAFKVSVVDPTGAGDALCAGIIRGLLKATNYRRCELKDLSNKDLIELMIEGEAAGASCVTMAGTTTAVTIENVNKIIQKQDSSIKNSVKVYPL